MTLPESSARAVLAQAVDRLFPASKVRCPHCGAEPGAYCRNRGGYTVPFHKARERATVEPEREASDGD